LEKRLKNYLGNVSIAVSTRKYKQNHAVGRSHSHFPFLQPLFLVAICLYA